MIVTGLCWRHETQEPGCDALPDRPQSGAGWRMVVDADHARRAARLYALRSVSDEPGIAPNMLTRRLKSLVKAGLLERRRYSEHPPRYEYLPTALGRDFRPVLIALLAWGNKHFAPEGESIRLVDRLTGKVGRPDPRRQHHQAADYRSWASVSRPGRPHRRVHAGATVCRRGPDDRRASHQRSYTWRN